MRKKNRKKNDFHDNIYIFKWVIFIAVFLIAGGVLSFALTLFTAHLMDGTNDLSPIWIVGMIPMMTLVAIPISFILYRQIKRNLSVLIKGMEKVANGDLEAYIPIANAKDFAKVYDNFNKMVAEIQSIETLRTSMFDNLSHELKTPIASINGFAKVLAEKDLSDEKKQKYLNIIVDESIRLENLVKNILLLSKLDSQEIITQKEEYNLTEQLQDCIISLENSWADKDIDIAADLENIKYNGESQLMKSLWLNLLSNAIKFTPKNGEVNVKLTSDDKNIIVTISDNGIGMSEEVQAHIFEKHFQADKKTFGSGQGLGLPIAKRIVRLCGGQIAVKSKIDEGSTFIVFLPKHA